MGETSAVGLFDGFFMHVVNKPRYCLVFCNANWLCRTDVFEKTDKSGKKGEWEAFGAQWRCVLDMLWKVAVTTQMYDVCDLVVV